MVFSGKAIFIALFLFCVISVAAAQTQDNPLLVYEAYTENGVLPGARAAGMGGAQIAAGMDGSALWYNPALLTRIRSTELSGTLTHQRMTNETSLIGGNRQKSNLGNTRLGSLWATYPVPTYRGGLTLGVSVNRVKSFDRIFRYSSGRNWLDNPYTNDGWGGGEDERGNLWAISVGGALEVAPKTSVGVSLDIFDGNDDYTYFFDSTLVADNYRFKYEHTISDGYTAVSGKIGITYSASNFLNVSGIIGFPSSVTVDQTSDTYQSDNQGFSDESHGAASYRYTLPFWFGAGAALRHRGFTLTGDVSYIDYTQLEYRSGLIDMMMMNRMVGRYYQDVFTYRIGAEYIIQPSGIRVRGGYYQDPIPFTGRPIETEPHYFTVGAGFIIDNSVNLDLAFLTGTWERDDPTIGSSEKYSVKRFMVTVSYRM